MKGDYKMLRFILLGISIVALMFFLEILLPKLKIKYLLYKEQKEAKKRKKAFKEKMNTLEIK